MNRATYVYDSYGSPDIRYTSFWWMDISGAPDSYLHNDVSYSYGNFSPYTNGSSNAWLVYPSGYVSSVNNYGVDHSYGRIQSPDTELFNMQYAWHVSQYGDANVIDAVYDLSSYGETLRIRMVISSHVLFIHMEFSLVLTLAIFPTALRTQMLIVHF